MGNAYTEFRDALMKPNGRPAWERSGWAGTWA